MFEDKTILITGGTGSFGHAVLQALLKTGVQEIRIFSRDEKKQDDMRNSYKNDRIKFYIGDVRDFSSIDFAMQGVDYVFHAAALKQVPSCEFHPLEAVKTNVLGAANVIEAAIKNSIEKVVVLSTDKAVYPVNAMGMSKAMMEKVMIARSRTLADQLPVLCGTRYGNVMATRGSVLTRFYQQIRSGQPLTITDPNMTRFLLLLEDAVDLVFYAFDHARPGDMFIRKAPSSTIANLAAAMRDYFNANNPITIIGTRHGEKLHETLVTREEMSRAEDRGDYFRVSVDDRDLNYGIYFEQGKAMISEARDYTSIDTKQLTVDEIKVLLAKLDFEKII